MTLRFERLPLTIYDRPVDCTRKSRELEALIFRSSCLSQPSSQELSKVHRSKTLSPCTSLIREDAATDRLDPGFESIGKSLVATAESLFRPEVKCTHRFEP